MNTCLNDVLNETNNKKWQYGTVVQNCFIIKSVWSAGIYIFFVYLKTVKILKYTHFCGVVMSEGKGVFDDLYGNP